MDKFIDVLCQIICGGTVGIITYWVSSKLWTPSEKKEALKHTMNYVLLPISSILLSVRKTKIEDLLAMIEKIDAIMNANPFDIPPTHRWKLNDVKDSVKNYKDHNDKKAKELLERKIRYEVSAYVNMFNIQCNYTKKQLGYPYDSVYDFLKYKTGMPVLAAGGLIALGIMWFIVYYVLYSYHEFIPAILTIVIPVLLFLLYAIGYRLLKDRGGLRVMIRDHSEKRALRKLTKNPNDDQKQQI